MLQTNKNMDYPQIETLDDDIALRVARLVVECSAPVDLAIAAVQDARTHDAEMVERKGSEGSFFRWLVRH